MFDQFKDILRDVKWAFGKREDRSEESQATILMRDLGERIPVSIGTALIIESDFAELDKWNPLVLINIRTLIRNLIGALPYQKREEALSDDIADVILEEMSILRQVIPEAKPGTEVAFYLPDYSNIMRDFKYANPKLYDTEKLKWEFVTTYRVCERLLRDKEDKEKEVDFITCSWKLEKDKRPTTLLTSFPSDLLSQYQFPKMNLLESHTGRVKGRKEWYTKLSGDKDTNRDIPFNKFTLTVYGDGVFFLVVNRKVKKIVQDMAARDKWNYMTSDAKIRMSISHLRHEEDRKILLEML